MKRRYETSGAVDDGRLSCRGDESGRRGELFEAVSFHDGRVYGLGGQTSRQLSLASPREVRSALRRPEHNNKMLRAPLIAATVALAAGHGAMNFPRPRNSIPGNWTADASCIGEACFWYQVGCFIGCENCTGVGKYLYPSASDFPAGCTLAEPTNNAPDTRTWDPHGHSQQGDFTKYNPVRFARRP